MKDITLTIQKNFGNKKASDIFEYVADGTLKNISDELHTEIKTAKIVYICAEDGLSDSTMGFISENKNADFRCYILVRKIDEQAWNNHPAKEKCIVREIPDLYGNYLVAENDETKTLFFADKNGYGISIADTNIVEKIKKVFINEFWNHATREYICGLGKIAETTFDVPIVKSDDTLILNQGLEGKSLLEKELQSAEIICADSQFSVNSFNKLKTVILSKLPNSEFAHSLTSKNVSLYYAPTSSLNFIKTANGFYLANFDVSKIDWSKQERNNRLFLLKIPETDCSVGKNYIFHSELLYNQCVEKELLTMGGKSFTVAQTGNMEVRTTASVGIFTMKQNGNSAEKWTDFLEKQNIFETEQNAVLIDFEITIPVKRKTFTKKAEVYHQFKNADSDIIAIFANGSKSIVKELSDINARLQENESEIKTLSEKDKNFKQWSEELNSQKAQLLSQQKEIENRQTEFNNLKSQIKESKTLNDVRANIAIIEKACVVANLKVPKISHPDFDLPQFGELFQDGNSFQYVLNDDENIEDAQNEMQSAKIQKVEFVEK